MNSGTMVRVARCVVNLNAVAGCHWEGQKLVVHFIGGRFEILTGEAANRIFKAISDQAFELIGGSEQGDVEVLEE